MPRMHQFLSALINQNPSFSRCPWKVCRIMNETCLIWYITVATLRFKLSYFDNRFYRAMLCMCGIALCLSLCLSVHLSVTSRCSTKTAKRMITHTTPHDSPVNLVFWCQRSPRNSTGITPCGGAKCRLDSGGHTWCKWCGAPGPTTLGGPPARTR